MKARPLLEFSVPWIRKTVMPAAVQTTAPSTTRRSARQGAADGGARDDERATQFEPSGAANGEDGDGEPNHADQP